MSTLNLEIFHERAAAAEQEIAFLKKEIEFLRQSITNNNSKIHSVPKDEYSKLEQENIKLKHRVAILKRYSYEASKWCDNEKKLESISILNPCL